jgi:hypothetical protein
VSVNRVSVNRVSVNRVSVNRVSVNRVSVNRVSVNRVSVNRGGPLRNISHYSKPSHLINFSLLRLPRVSENSLK